jgi:hemin uptake protein HemP
MSPRLSSHNSEPKSPHEGASAPARLRSTDLLQGGRRVVIEHGEASYTLLLTKNDKLILVK